MSDDTIERAEDWLRTWGKKYGPATKVVTDLVSELKATQAAEDRLLHEIFNLQDDLKAARAEVERLQNWAKSLASIEYQTGDEE